MWKDITCAQADNVLNNPNYYTASDHNETVGSSDYWDQYTKTWTNVPDSTYYNQDPSVKTIHNEKSNYKE